MDDEKGGQDDYEKCCPERLVIAVISNSYFLQSFIVFHPHPPSKRRTIHPKPKIGIQNLGTDDRVRHICVV